MALREQISAALKEAMKAKEMKRVSAVRLIMAAVQERDIAARADATDEEILGVLSKMIKQREESAATYEGAGRAELAATERDEIAVIRGFMPKQLSPEEMKAAVAQAVAETGASGMKDMGKVMGALKAKYAGSMDFAKAGAAVKELLTPK